MAAVRPRVADPAATGRVLAADDRLDQAEVAVPPPVEDVDALGRRVDVHEELVTELLHPSEGVLLEHRLDGESLRLDDPALDRGVRGAVGDVPEERLLLVRPGP